MTSHSNKSHSQTIHQSQNESASSLAICKFRVASFPSSSTLLYRILRGVWKQGSTRALLASFPRLLVTCSKDEKGLGTRVECSHSVWQNQGRGAPSGRIDPTYTYLTTWYDNMTLLWRQCHQPCLQTQNNGKVCTLASGCMYLGISLILKLSFFVDSQCLVCAVLYSDVTAHMVHCTPVIYKYHHSTNLYRKISRVCCCTCM